VPWTPWCDRRGGRRRREPAQGRGSGGVLGREGGRSGGGSGGRSGGGLVTVTMSGKGEMMKVGIDPSLMKPDEAEILEDLIVAASQDAKGKVEALMQEKMAEVTGGLPIPPGMKLF